MAQTMVVQKCLTVFASNYGKTDSWVEGTMKLWSRGLHDVHDRDLIRGTEEWCRKKSKPPNLARLRELIEGNPQTMEREQKVGCPACSCTGWREVARWFLKNGRTQVFNGVAPCDCPRGQRFAAGGPTWGIIVDQWRNNGFTEKVFHGTAEHPHLTTQQRMTPEQIEEAKERQDKVRTSVSGWKRLTK